MFPEVKHKEMDVKEILDEEEESFSRTLDRGEKMFEHYASKSTQQNSKKLDGADVWRLYDTFGFPVDLTRLMAGERGLDIDDKEFEDAQAKAKEASKGVKKASGVDLVKLDVHDLGKLEQMDGVPKSDDSFKFGMVHFLCRVGGAKPNGSDRTREYHSEHQGHLLPKRVPQEHQGYPFRWPTWIDFG
jgi:alanyl-tRNA synthetase